MIDALILILGFFVAFLGLSGGILSYAFTRISDLMSLLLGKSSSPSVGTTVGFFFLFLSGVFMILFVSLGSPERRYRFLCTFSVLSSAVSSLVFLYKTIFLGLGWLGVELVGESTRPFVLLSLMVTSVAVLTFLSALSRLAVEISE